MFNMKILFLGSLFEKKAEDEILRKSKINRISNAGNILQWNIIEGLDSNLKNPVDILNCMPIGTYPKYYEDIRFKTKKWAHTAGAEDLEIGSFNLPGIKEFERVLGYRKAIFRWIKKNIKEEKHIIIFTPYPPFFPALYRLTKDITVTLVVADVPLLGVRDPLSLKITYNLLVKPLLKRVDNFVLLTKQMTIPMNVGDRPYVVMEGIADIREHACHPENRIRDRKIIFYTGALQNQYGIANLLDAFESISNPEYELWLCGWGSSENDIIERCKKDPRIKFFGYVANDEIRRMQQQATLLVNPRTNEGEFTKYSFPSKTIEYMLSGRPVLMYKLEGTPEEYDQYLHYIDGNTTQDMATKIVKICEKTDKELDEFGTKARQFILDKKNKVVQTRRILEMLSKSAISNNT